MVREVSRALLLAASSVLVGAVTAEVAVRVLNPVPRTQVVREGRTRRLYEMNGVPMWQDTQDAIADLLDEDCEAPRRVTFVGDSILQVSSIEPDPNLVTPLREALGSDWCVHNRAQAGFIAQQKAQLALHEISTRAPDLLVWEVWGERGEVRQFGDTIVGVGGYTVDAAGYPVIPGVPMPGALHHGLFAWSRAWQYAVLALGVTEVFDSVLPHFDRVLQAAEAADVQLALVFMPELERPFGVPSPVVDTVQQRVQAWGAEHGLPMVRVGDAFAGVHDHEVLRLDPCCHYNREGHAALAQLFATMIDDLEDGTLDVTPGRVEPARP